MSERGFVIAFLHIGESAKQSCPFSQHMLRLPNRRRLFGLVCLAHLVVDLDSSLGLAHFCPGGLGLDRSARLVGVRAHFSRIGGVPNSQRDWCEDTWINRAFQVDLFGPACWPSLLGLSRWHPCVCSTNRRHDDPAGTPIEMRLLC